MPSVAKAFCAFILSSVLPAVTISQSTEETHVPLYSFSLHAPYIDDTLMNRHWDFGGSTIVDISKFVRLTQDTPSKEGWLWSKEPLHVPNWMVEFEYSIHGRSTTLYGDGFAMWFGDRGTIGPVFGNMQNYKGLAIIFDTFPNSAHRYTFPYVMAAIGDGHTPYVHNLDGQPNELAGCPSDIRGRDFPTKARVKYMKGEYLELQLNTKNGIDGWVTCFRTNATLPEEGYIGFSAATGEVHDNHDIINVAAWSIVTASSSSWKGEYVEHHGSDYSGSGVGGFLWGLVKFIFWACVLLVIGYVGFRFYSKKKNQDYKRF